MANTASTTSPVAPLGGTGVQAGLIIEGVVNASTAIVKGDILITGSGLLTTDHIAPTVLTTVGVALEDAAVDVETRFAAAVPGALFSANMIEAAGTDEVSGVYAENIGLATNVAEEDQDGNACLIDSNGTNTPILVWTVRYDQQRPTSTEGAYQSANPLTAGVGVRNPRVVFMFTSSALNGVV